MRTRCPSCQTVFRITTEQIKARSGKVRCGHCKSIFNALDKLFGENMESPLSFPEIDINMLPAGAEPSLPQEKPSETGGAGGASSDGDISAEAFSVFTLTGEEIAVAASDLSGKLPPVEEKPMAAPAAREVAEEQEVAKAAGLVMPRETSEIPGYSKWSEEAVAELPSQADRPVRWPFVLVGALLVLLLAGQAIFHYRSELAVSFPQQRSLLEAFSHALDSTLPLPAHAEMVSIETSDLQNDTAHNLLVLNATLRNRAPYGQLYPSLELSLTDTQDTAIARRIFSPKDYLPPKLSAAQPFAGNSDVAVRLWIDAREIGAAGYRLYVFYP